MLSRHSKYVIATGFISVLALMTGLLTFGISRMDRISSRLGDIVNQYNAKTDLALQMRTAARERVLILNVMAITDDPFERDDLMQRFNEYATDFAVARMALLEKPLTDKEREILTTQARRTTRSTRLQSQVMDLFAADHLQQGRRLLIREALPAQTQVLSEIDRLFVIYKEAIGTASTEAFGAYHEAHTLLLVLGSVTLLLGLVITVVVIRTVRKAEDQLFDEKELAQVTLYSIDDAVITVDSAGRVDSLNRVAERLTGWSTDAARTLALEKIFAVTPLPDDGESTPTIAGELSQPASKALLNGRDGEQRWIEHSMLPIRDRNGAIVRSVVTFRDVTAARTMAQKLSWQASHDPLTNLINRREFERRLNALLKKSKHAGDESALLYIDLDQFKLVNDTCGHVAGDELLRQLGSLLASKLRYGDLLARLGGDEFGIVLENCSLEGGRSVATSLLESISGFRFVWADRFFDISASIGVVAIGADEQFADLLRAADAACYAAKDGGRNRIHVYQPDDQELLRRQGEMQWVSRIQKALNEDRFCLRFQKIVPLGAGSRHEHCEIFISMIDEQDQMVPPAAFIPAAERYGLMPLLDRWVVRAVFSAQAAVWRKLYEKNGPKDFCCAINLSATSINDSTFADFLREQIALHRVPPAALCFELTETAAIANLNSAREFMVALREIGCRFALDDFGTGMSSFAYLKNLPVDYLKIDGSFVRQMLHNAIDLGMVDAINRIGHLMGLKTIAEFVEDQAILERLREMGVDYAQGYGVHKPECLAVACTQPPKIKKFKEGGVAAKVAGDRTLAT